MRTKTINWLCLLLPLSASLPAWADPAPAAPAPQLSAEQLSGAVKQALDEMGFQFDGYMRSGFYGSSGDNQPKSQYQLGGDLQHFRLGNEGDTYIELGIGKKWTLGNGVSWGAYVMPTIYNGKTSASQVYGYISGLEFAPNLTLWAGQRYHRIQDIHIVDNWLMQDGDNYGAGVDGIAIGQAKLNLSVSSSGNYANDNATLNNARRANFQLAGIATNPGGKLTLTGAAISGDFAIGKPGAALGLLHNQKDFLAQGVNNSLFLQTSTGHASLSGQFYNLDNAGAAQAGARQSRIADVLDWQRGRFGGQAVMGWQTASPDNAAKYLDATLGGRLSYGVAANVKLLTEIGLTSRDTDNQPQQRLNKATVAVAFAPNTDFWTRPELRVYASHYNWNNAAAQANLTTFAANGRTHANTFGVQLEAWW
ncbi:carbohydrate porin [Chromobacterium alticapitis]|uniref:Maltoporin n=1 Tax=Chromobacterium alticapitis TaxID=2073169 RepID=A0A2S5DFW0_9NEIS|nr:carbohydrate porin [Chromobacterium alticapitis]POZ61924.1 maltoporin [Chromobacterium alticapitis]